MRVKSGMGVEKVVCNKPGRSAITPTMNEENLAKKTFQLTDSLHREMISSQVAIR